MLEKRKSGTLEGYTFIDTKATFLTELEGFEGAYEEKLKNTIPTIRTVFLVHTLFIVYSIGRCICIESLIHQLKRK